MKKKEELDGLATLELNHRILRLHNEAGLIKCQITITKSRLDCDHKWNIREHTAQCTKCRTLIFLSPLE